MLLAHDARLVTGGIVNWVWIRDQMPRVGAVVFAFALGGWVVSIRDQAATLPYKNAATVKLQQVEKVAGLNPVAQINCLARKSAVATAAAHQAVKAVNDENTPVPNLSDIKNCPKVAKK